MTTANVLCNLTYFMGACNDTSANTLPLTLLTIAKRLSSLALPSPQALA